MWRSTRRPDASGGQRADQLDPVLREELRKLSVRSGFQDGQVAAIDDMPTERGALLDQPSKAGVELRGTASDVHDGDSETPEHVHTLLGCLPRHDLGAVGSSIDVAVPTRLIAELADVDLKDLDRRGPQRPQSLRTERVSERLLEGQAMEQRPLMLTCGKR